MTFDNSKTIISFRIKFFVATVSLLAFIILTYAAKIFKFPFLGLSDYVWTIILVGLWLFIALIPMILNYQFIYFSDEGENIIFRYFYAGIVGGKKNSVEINKRTFSGYKTETNLFGLNVSLILFQKINNGTAKYPPIFISALSREQRSKVYKSLNQYFPLV